jgi:hypothetical protein
VDTASTGETPGVGMTQRHQKRLAAQPLLTPLKAWAHHPSVGGRQWLTPSVPTRRRWGIMRLGREVLHVQGRLTVAHGQGSSHLRVNAADPLATRWLTAWCAVLESEHMAVTLGKT